MIKKIVLEINEKEIELTLEQAKKLKSSLDEIFKELNYCYIFSPIQKEPYKPYIPFLEKPWISVSSSNGDARCII